MKTNGDHRQQDGHGGAHAAPAGAGPLTLAEAAEYLNVTERFMRRLVAERRISYHKLGGLLRFLPADLDQLLQASRVEADPLPGRR